MDGVVCGYQLALVRPNPDLIDGNFLFRSFSSRGINDQFRVAANGITRYGLGQHWLRSGLFCIPSVDEQRAIAAFLDREIERIDALIAKKERQVELLQEKRTALISHAVAKGLDPNAPMKDSSVEWLGEIPAHWSVVRCKAVFSEVDERSEFGTEELLSVSHITGVTPRSEKNVTMFMAETLEDYKKCRTGDLVINTMWAWMGALGTASQHGVVSPSYNVYRFRRAGPNARYYDRLFRTGRFVAEINRFSQGVWKSRLGLYPEEFLQIRIPYPPDLEQAAIALFLDREAARIDELVSKVQGSIETLREYRTALVSAAVTGKIDVRQEGGGGF
jgi:type I restriction enzyme S subunit